MIKINYKEQYAFNEANIWGWPNGGLTFVLSSQLSKQQNLLVLWPELPALSSGAVST